MPAEAQIPRKGGVDLPVLGLVRHIVQVAGGVRLVQVDCGGVKALPDGTDAAGQQKRAEDKGDHWLLNGAKVFITNGGYADTYVVMAMTDKKKGTRGIS